MEVKIKQGEEMLDATIEMVDGVMVVSPNEVRYEPKDGDVFCVDSLSPCVGIVKEVYSYGKIDKDRLYFSVGYWKQSETMQFGTFCACNRNTQLNYRPATKEEKNELFDKLAEEGYEWEADTKELVKLKWKPSMYDPYYSPFYDTFKFIPMGTNWNGRNKDNIRYNKGLCFKVEKECQEFCNRLNDAIKSVKP